MKNHEPNDHEISAKRKNTATKRRHDIINNNDQEHDDTDLLALSLLTWSQPKPPKRTTPDYNNTPHSPAAAVIANTQHYELTPPPPPPPSPLILPSYQGFQNPSPQTLMNTTITHPFFTAPSPISPSPNLDPYNNVITTASSSTTNTVGPSRAPRARRNPTQTPRDHSKSESITPPFPWATNHRATVHNLEYLLSKKIDVITGSVQCKRCEKQYELEFNLREKFVQVGTFIAENKNSMHDRAPSVWMNPLLPTCKYCEQENSVKPVISDKKKGINWLFLLLGQMLGCCTLEQLKYFCKHTKNHRTGAKDRVLYLTYLGLCKQLDPCGPFDR